MIALITHKSGEYCFGNLRIEFQWGFLHFSGLDKIPPSTDVTRKRSKSIIMDK